MSTITQTFDQDGFRFDVKARPTFDLRLPDDAPAAERQAWAQLEAMGVHPTAAAFPQAHTEVKNWQVTVRAETQRPWTEVLDQEWPAETNVHVGPWAIGDTTATLVCHAAAVLPAGTDLVAAMAERLRLEGPIGQEAAAAFLTGSLEPEQVPTPGRQEATPGIH
jgi:hypothetical protein